MKNFKKVRSLPKQGAKALVLTSLLFALVSCSPHGGKKDTDKSSSKTEVTTTCTTTSTTTSTGTTSTTLSTTTSTETTTTTTVVTTLMIEPIVTTQMIATPIEVQPVIEQTGGNYSDSDAVLLAQLINKEASATYDGKLAVASVVLNRANYYGQTISEVIYAPNQFTTAYSLGYYTDSDYQAATEILSNGSVNNAYFFNGCHPDCLNWFYDINYNYIYAA